MDKRAKTVSEAAYNHLLVFTQPVNAWPIELAKKLPSFSELYMEPTGEGRRPGPVNIMLAQLRNVPGPVKLLLTGQKGAGKSWSLQHLREQLTEYRVVWVSTPDTAATTAAEVELADLLVLLCEALSKEISDWSDLVLAGVELRRWVNGFKGLRGLPIVPDEIDNIKIDIGLVFAKVATTMRSDLDVRDKIRSVGASDLVVIANDLLRVLNRKKPVLVLFDDLDKINMSSARKLFGPQFNVLESLSVKMVLTFPFALNFENTLTQRREILRNVKVRENQQSQTLRPAALERFTELLLRLVEPGLVDGLVVEQAVRFSGGITREFGRIIARAFEFAALWGEDRVQQEHVLEAIQDLRIEMERATQDQGRRESLKQVAMKNELKIQMDRDLLNENMVVEYVNGHPWYDVHPLLVDVVKNWPTNA